MKCGQTLSLQGVHCLDRESFPSEDNIRGDEIPAKLIQPTKTEHLLGTCSAFAARKPSSGHAH